MTAPAADTVRVPRGFLEKLRTLSVDRAEVSFKHKLTDWTLMEWGCAIGGECGELQNALKKIRREEQGVGGSRLDNPVQFVADEIADIIIYCDLLAARMGIDLQQAIAHKFDETSAKMGYGKALAAAADGAGEK